MNQKIILSDGSIGFEIGMFDFESCDIYFFENSKKAL
jgi:hypothetical protein